MLKHFLTIPDHRTAIVRTMLSSLLISHLTVSAARIYFGALLPEAELVRTARFEVYTFCFALLFCTPILYAFMRAFWRVNMMNLQLMERAETDVLTGLYNRGAFRERIEAFQLGARAGDGTGQDALLVIDADNFKAINDTYGHLAGDAALKMIALCIEGNCFERDIVARLGGEEFAVFLKNAGPEGAALAGERIRQAVEANTAHFQRQSIRVTVSIGATHYPRDVSFDDVYKAADSLLYRAKHGGRNRVEINPFGASAAPRLRVVA